MGLLGLERAAGLTTLAGADNDGHVGSRKLRIDLVHLHQLVVGHVGLGQQHVHVARHAPGDGVDAVLHGDTTLLQLIGELLDLTLRARHFAAP